MPIILHGIARVINSISMSTDSFIISIKSLFDNLFCNLPYNITARAMCNHSSREIYSLDRHEAGNTFFFLIQKIDAKLELKNNHSTIETSLLAKLLLSSPIHFLAQSVFLFIHRKYCIASSILYTLSDVMIEWEERKIFLNIMCNWLKR